MKDIDMIYRTIARVWYCCRYSELNTAPQMKIQEWWEDNKELVKELRKIKGRIS